MKVEEAYEVMQAASGIKVGDRVRALRGFKSREMGTSLTSPIPSGDRERFLINKASGIVTGMGSNYIVVDCGPSYGREWAYPFFIFEIVEAARTIERNLR